MMLERFEEHISVVMDVKTVEFMDIVELLFNMAINLWSENL